MSKNVKWFTILIPTFYFLIPLILKFNYDSSFLRIKFIELYINCIPITVCVIFLIKKAIVNNFYKLVVLTSFIVYLCSLHQVVTFIPVWYWGSPVISSTTPLLNLVPFKTILESEITQLMGPLLMLTPLAFALMSLSILKSKKKTIMVTMLISIGIELIQFIENSTGSAFDLYSRLTNIDDVILNTLGGVIGVYIYLLFNHFISKGQSERLQI
ncbi:VanZ family protein [Bacillus sp. ISL-4]|uniref:VanZ family protein n=1 Tax=Bacillus sp. ISL-4 TaxID=2819125 RepID=UPI001BE90E97|nr:VanZ family protein [Bacillus sp. ISL-4]MBT2667350.1 VanZ family protein [Bacillus sp. ISL-4]